MVNGEEEAVNIEHPTSNIEHRSEEDEVADSLVVSDACGLSQTALPSSGATLEVRLPKSLHWLDAQHLACKQDSQ